MAGAYIGIDGKARKIKMYIGVNGKARKVSKAYIGINKLARPFYKAVSILYPTNTISCSLATSNVYVGSSYSFKISGSTIEDNSEITYRIENISSGVTISKTSGIAENETLTFKSTNVASVSFTIVAVSSKYNTESAGVKITRSVKALVPTNTISCSLATSNVYVGSSYSFKISGSTIEDNSGVTYKITGISSGVTISKTTGITENESLTFKSTSQTSVSFTIIAVSSKYNTESAGVKITRSVTEFTVLPLSVARRYLSATTVGNYALFGGGYSSGYQAVVDAYDTSLTRSTPTALSQGRSELVATTIGNYALFGGGNTGSVSAVVDAYNTSLTRSKPTALSQARQYLADTSVGNYALFGGGTTASTRSAVVDAYNTSLTRSTPTALSVARYSLSSTSVGSYALFGGGYYYNNVHYYSAVVDAYNTSLTRSTPTALSQVQRYLAATTVGNYALFGGGGTGSVSAVVNAYNKSLTRSTPTALSQARRYLSSTTVGNYALFGGGYSSGSPYSSAVVDAYNTSLTRSTPTALSVARYNLAATTVGSYGLFGGGYTGSSYSAVVDAYDKNLKRISSN